VTMEGFVRMSGTVMGLARESFGTGIPAGKPAPMVRPRPDDPSGSGAAARAADSDAAAVGHHLDALGSHDGAAGAHVDGAAAAAAAGRDRMDAVIGSAAGDVDALAPVSDTPHGRRALVAALTRHLKETKGVLDDGAADASTRAAATSASAAGYRGLGQFPAAPIALPAAPAMPQLPVMPLSALGQLPTMLGQWPLPDAGHVVESSNTVGGDDGWPVSGASAIPVGQVRFDRGGSAGGAAAYREHIAKALDVLGIRDPVARANWSRGLMVGLARESGFNPAAVNLSDSNAHGAVMPDGAPANSSRGGLQTIPATFAANHQPGTSTNIYDPVANLCAAMNYLMRRYHITRDGANLSAVGQFNAHHHPQGY
jgi:hypothetical protein